MKKGIKAIVFTLIGLGLLYYINGVLIMKRTDGITTMQNLYAQEEGTVDVLLLGSSRTGMNLDTAEMWRKHGVAAYALWGSIQPLWNSYYFLREALKTQEPKVVVLDVSGVTKDFEYSDESRQVTNTAGMKLSRNKIEAIMATAPKERWMDLILGYPLYHTRYSELTENDFRHFAWSDGLINDKGSSSRYGIGDFELQDVTDIKEAAAIYEKQERYLRKIIEFCLEEDICLVLIATPAVNRVIEQPYYNSVQEIADEYDIMFYNFNLMDAETGFTAEDYWTDGAHINTSGARKISDWLANRLKLDYDLTDHRGDVQYISWDINENNINNEYLKNITNTDAYINELSERNLCMVVRKGELVEDDGDRYHELLNGDSLFSVEFGKNTEGVLNKKKKAVMTEENVICYILDKTVQRCVDIVSFTEENGLKLQHIS